jgi:hypothetical protein
MGTAPMGMSRLSALTLMIMSWESPSERANSLGRSALKVSKLLYLHRRRKMFFELNFLD